MTRLKRIGFRGLDIEAEMIMTIRKFQITKFYLHGLLHIIKQQTK